jgi:phospholipase/carboxylesterase
MALNGPTIAPARGKPTHLVVLVHGYGADGQDLIGLAEHWRALLPTVAFAAPNAPTRIPGGPGYQWFPISRIDPHEMQKGVEVAAPLLDAYLDAELARLNLPPERLALAGFSQGTMLSLHLGLRRRVRPASNPEKPTIAVGLAGAAVQWHLAPGMGHGIDPEGLMMAGGFLAMAFGGLLKSRGEIRSVYKAS